MSMTERVSLIFSSVLAIGAILVGVWKVSFQVAGLTSLVMQNNDVLRERAEIIVRHEKMFDEQNRRIDINTKEIVIIKGKQVMELVSIEEKYLILEDITGKRYKVEYLRGI